MSERLEALVGQVLEEMRDLRSEVRAVKQDLAEFKTEVRTGLAEVKQDLAEVKQDLAEFKTEVRGEFAVVHRELGLVKAAVLDTARRVADHEVRITALEAARPAAE